MANDSSTGGYLLPDAVPAPQPLEGQALQRFLQQFVMNVTGLGGTLVRPRWQPEPPIIPEDDVSWAAIGVIRRQNDTYAAHVQIESTDGRGRAQMRRHQFLFLKASFYGTSADANAGIFCDGLQVAQNREFLYLNGFAFVESGEPTTAPTIVKERWRYQVDVDFTVRRRVTREYSVLDLLQQDVSLVEEAPTASTVNFGAAELSFPETDGEGQITVLRTGDATEAASVDVSCPAVNIELAPLTVEWAVGESGAKIVTVSLLGGITVNLETTLELSDPIGATLGPLDTAELTVTVEVPLAPSELVAELGSVNLSWQNNDAYDTISVERCTGAACSGFAEIASISGALEAYEDTTVAETSIYRYRIRGVQFGNNSPYSNIAEITTPINAPSALTVTAFSSSAISLAWTDNSAVEIGFRIQRCTGDDCTGFVDLVDVAANVVVYEDTTVTFDTTYRYRVAAKKSGGGLSDWSNIVSRHTPVEQPRPVGLVAVADGFSAVDLTWFNGTTYDDILVQRCTGAACSGFVTIATISGLLQAYQDDSADEAVTYRYRVIGVISAAQTDPSDPAQVSVPLAPPSGLNITGSTATSIGLAWTDNSGVETGFEIQRCEGEACSGFATIHTTAAGVVVYSDTGLTSGTVYRYRVRAVAAGPVNSDWSNTAEETTSNYYSATLFNGDAVQPRTITTEVDVRSGLLLVKPRSSTADWTLLTRYNGNSFWGLGASPETFLQQISTQMSFDGSGFSVLTAANPVNEINPAAQQIVAYSFAEHTRFLKKVEAVGTGANRTITHGAGFTPRSIWAFRSDTGFGPLSVVGHEGLDAATPWNRSRSLFSSGANTVSSTYWNNTAPTATEFTVGTDGGVNSLNRPYSYYLFNDDAASDGVIRTGAYVGANPTPTDIVHGWPNPPRFLLIIGNNVSPMVFDSTRSPGYIGQNLVLNLGSNAAELLSANLSVPVAGTLRIINSAFFTPNTSGVRYSYILIR